VDRAEPDNPCGGGERADDLEALLSALTASAAFGAGTGRGVRVGLIDSGADPAALARPPAGEAVFRLSADGTVERPAAPTGVRSPHGTAVAQIITRLAPDVELHSADVLDATGRGAADLVLAGLEWALDRGCRVINVSLGLTAADLPRAERRWRFAEIVERAYFADAVIVAAAHNLHDTGVEAFPALFGSAIAVGRRLLGPEESVEYRAARPAEFAACGKAVHPQFRFQSATSFAAPHVTALIARLLERHPGLKPFEIKTILYRAAERR
jgi:subtilisin family serine protease